MRAERTVKGTGAWWIDKLSARATICFTARSSCARTQKPSRRCGAAFLGGEARTGYEFEEATDDGDGKV